MTFININKIKKNICIHVETCQMKAIIDTLINYWALFFLWRNKCIPDVCT
jgi:hypothetical protein